MQGADYTLFEIETFSGLVMELETDKHMCV